MPPVPRRVDGHILYVLSFHSWHNENSMSYMNAHGDRTIEGYLLSIDRESTGLLSSTAIL